jgi:hypothetical protein
VARHGLTLLASEFGTKMGSGIAMAVRSAGFLEDADEIAASCEALAGDLLGSFFTKRTCAFVRSFSSAFVTTSRCTWERLRTFAPAAANRTRATGTGAPAY